MKRYIAINGLRRRLSLSLIVALAVFVCAPAFSQDEEYGSGIDRIVAVGDIHGAYDEFISILQANQLVDDSLAWTGGRTHFVSVGDLLDRGPDSRQVMDLLMRLQSEAAASGGRVHVVLGNHELMNLIGDLRYVSSEEFAAYADQVAADLRNTAFEQYAAAQDPNTDPGELLRVFDARYPTGYFGHRAAFAPAGRYGRWLLDLPAVVVLNRRAFVHGGLGPQTIGTTTNQINLRVKSSLVGILDLRAQLAALDVLPPVDMQDDYTIARGKWIELEADPTGRSSPVFELLTEFLALNDSVELGLNGPMWYRGSVYCKPLLEEPVLNDALSAVGADRVVVGHTPTNNSHVQSLYGDKLYMLDTGMLKRYYRGRPAALIFDGDTVSVQYADPVEAGEPTPQRRELGDAMTKTEILQALATAQWQGDGAPSGGGPIQIDLDNDGRIFPAIFYPNNRGAGAMHQLAAYELSEALHFDLVPPTVLRDFGAAGQGAVQYLGTGSINEFDRIERQLGLGSWCDMPAQVRLMYTFDTLIANEARSAQNLFYRNDMSDVFLVDHGQTFSTNARAASDLPIGAFELDPGVHAALQDLDEDALTDRLGDLLSNRQIRAILARRTLMLERLAGDPQ